MNYYERHLGDYARDTAHLTLLEHGAYTLLLDRYYTTERPIPCDDVHRLARARTREEKAAVSTVLFEFFHLRDDHWHHNYADRVIEKTRTKIKAAQENGKRGGRPKANPEDNPTPTDPKPTGFSPGSISETQKKALQTPNTRHQEIPPTPAKRGGGSVHQFPPGFDRFWLAYPRKTAKPKAVQAFVKLRPDEPLLLAILAAVAEQATWEQWTKDGGQFIPHPATWLNGRRWEDQGPSIGQPINDIFAGTR